MNEIAWTLSFLVMIWIIVILIWTFRINRETDVMRLENETMRKEITARSMANSDRCDQQGSR